MGYGQSNYEPRQIPSGLGCLLVFPTAIFGTAMLTDDGPHGWHLSAEFLGWWTLCVGVSLACAWVSAKLHATGRRRSPYLAAGTIAMSFLLLTIAEVQPNTPAIVKDIATAPLQPLGVIGAVGLILLISRARGRSYRS